MPTLSPLFHRHADLRTVLADLGLRTGPSSERIMRIPGWKPRSFQAMILAMPEGLNEPRVV